MSQEVAVDFALMMSTLAGQFPQAFAYAERPDEKKRADGKPPKSYWLGLLPKPGKAGPQPAKSACRCLHVSKGKLVPLYNGDGPFKNQDLHDLLKRALPARVVARRGVAVSSSKATALWHSFVSAGLRLHGLIP